MSAVEQAHLISLLGPHTRQHVLQLLARCPGLTVSSTLRTPERNRAVGGVKGSYHLKGRAADFVGSRRAIEEGARVARSARLGPKCTGPEEVLDEGDHLHVAW
jgi:hypothetical protein